MFSYYSDGTTVESNEPITAVNTPHSTEYILYLYLDSTLMSSGFNFYYKIYAVDKGIIPESNTDPDSGYYELVYDTTITNVLKNNNIIEYTLEQNFPNPFNPVTQIEYSVKEYGLVELDVFDLLGRKVAIIVNKEQPRGKYSVEFNASDLASGIYFYRLKVNDFIRTKKMILLR